MTFTDQLNGPTPPTTALPTIDVDGNGVGRAVVDWPRVQRVTFEVCVESAHGETRQWQLHDRAYARDGDALVMRATFDGAAATLEQRTGPASVDYAIVAHDAIANVAWRFAVPAEAFDDADASVFGDRAAFTSRDGARRVEMRFDRPMPLRARVNGSQVELVATPHAGPLPAGSRVSFSVAMRATVSPATRPATVTLDASRRLNAFDGTGGNFVFSIDDPTTDLALSAMRPAWARIGLDGGEWDGGDVAGSPLRARCALARRLTSVVGNDRLILSMWYPPERLFAEPAGRRERAGTIPRERWPALADVIVGHLRHLRDRYHVEPALFSFNESDLGVYLRLDADETLGLTRLLGDRFRAAGVSTRLLLGDSSDLAGGLAQIGPTLADDSARSFVGALAHHPWNDQRNEWPRWAALAARHGLPLLATEVGVDFDGYRLGSYNAPLSTLRLARRYVELIRDARVRALLEWEWTGNYAMTERHADGTLALSPRGAVLRQLNRATPANAFVVETLCDDPTLDAVALIGGHRAAVHLVNSDATREVRIVGLPMRRAMLSTVDARTGEIATSRVDVIDRVCSVVVPAAALATVTSVD